MIPAADDHALADALLAARLLAKAPAALGGLILYGGGERRGRVLAALTTALRAGAPVVRMPANVDDERLVGGLDLGSALAGRGVHRQQGLLAQADGGLLVASSAHTLQAAAVARLAAALDRHDTNAAGTVAGIGLVALAEQDAEQQIAPALAERLAFVIDLDAPMKVGETETPDGPVADDEAIAALTATAAMFGIGSARASLLALRAARAAAALEGRDGMTSADLRLAARLVLAPRATRLPAEADATPPPPAEDRERNDEKDNGDDGALEDRVIDAVAAALPAHLFDPATGTRRGPAPRLRGAGERRRSPSRGRRTGVRAGTPGGGKRLALIETLRAAAPWQGVRGRTDRVLVRKDDLRVGRYQAKAMQLTVMAVDASGSTAAARLAEAKGAVQLLLSRAYVARAEVALIAFRGEGAELLLPPTRSLARAKRALADLPGGGGTPLAAGIAAAHQIAVSARAKGRTPLVVLLSDGRGNIATDGSHGRAAAEKDALAAAKALAVDGITAAFVDNAARPRPEGAKIAEAMRARYLALPYAGAQAIDTAIATLTPA